MAADLGPTWQEVVARRYRREDEAVALKWAAFKYLGRGYVE